MWRDRRLSKPLWLLSVVALLAAACAPAGVVPLTSKVSAADPAGSASGGPLRPPGLTRGGTAASSLAPTTGALCTPAFTAVTSSNSGLAVNELSSVAAITPNDVWAVGFANAGTVPALDRTLALHWNGSTWATVATPNLGDGFNNLSAVAANDTNDVWAVGNSQTGGVFQNLAVHWNGIGWSAVATPQPSTAPSPFQALGGVAALGPSNVWAVGTYRNRSGVKQSLALRWNGSGWAIVATPNAGAGDNVLESVFARSATDIWAAGYYRATAGNPQLTLIEHYDGTAWTIQTSPNAGAAGASNVLYGISASSATEVWAVGYTATTTASVTSYTTLVEHLVAGNWTVATSLSVGTGDNYFTAVVTLSGTNTWAVGLGKATSIANFAALVEHWDGTSWSIQTADNPGVTGNAFFGLAALPGNVLWAVGGGVASTAETTLVEQFQLPAPTAVTAAPATAGAATVTWTAPACTGGFATTGYQVTATDGCAVQGTWPAASSPATITGLTTGTPLSFVVQAVSASLGAETPSAASAAVTPTGNATYSSACSSKQYQLASSDPATFVDMDPTALSLSFTTTTAMMATITGNADLWTANAGLNQDIGIFVSGGVYGAGQVVAWKESGGSAGTFSPNAAAVQAVIPFSASTAYVVTLQWKGSRAFPGASIFAAAGPIGGDYRWSGSKGYSPTRLSVRQSPTATPQVFSRSTNTQYQLAGNDGQTWVDMDATGLSIPVTATVPSMALIMANVDLWTANSGYNQDIAINVDSTIAAWKESGGSAGTFSPNAAFVQAVVPLTAGTHNVKLQWKTNGPEGGATVFAGAGPWPAASTPAKFSPTQLTIWLMPIANLTPASSTAQTSLTNSDAAGWTPIDTSRLQLTLTPASTTTYLLSGNVDLWTANAGFNQDVAIIVSGGVYGAGTPVAWKESGGLAGTYSPNAAYVETMLSVAPGTYTVWLAWKTNNLATGSQIFAGAGPWPAGSSTFSPTKLTAAVVT